MRPYLDDDSVDPLLVTLLRKAGHDVRLPFQIGLSGSHDAVHLKIAIREARVLLTGNHKDFIPMQELIMESQGHHPGIFLVRRDNDPKRDMVPAGVVRAIGKILAANYIMRDQLEILNHWR
jgi:hypothetical protein